MDRRRELEFVWFTIYGPKCLSSDSEATKNHTKTSVVAAAAAGIKILTYRSSRRRRKVFYSGGQPTWTCD